MVRKCPSCSAENRVPSSKLDKVARCGKCKLALPHQAHPVAIASAQDFSELIDHSPLPVVVDFWAPWCGPCRMVGPELEKVAKGKAGHVIVAKVNTDEVPEVASRFGITSIPTLILFKAGKEAKRVSGAMQAPQLEHALGI